eukprot:gene34051-54215_t
MWEKHVIDPRKFYDAVHAKYSKDRLGWLLDMASLDDLGAPVPPKAEED